MSNGEVTFILSGYVTNRAAREYPDYMEEIPVMGEVEPYPKWWKESYCTPAPDRFSRTKYQIMIRPKGKGHEVTLALLPVEHSIAKEPRTVVRFTAVNAHLFTQQYATQALQLAFPSLVIDKED